jgi:hypothetical protein
MKHQELPDYKEKQRVLYLVKTAPAALSALGDRYLAAGRIADAIECFGLGNDTDKLRTILALAEEEGDVQFFLQVLKALNREATREGPPHVCPPRLREERQHRRSPAGS